MLKLLLRSKSNCIFYVVFWKHTSSRLERKQKSFPHCFIFSLTFFSNVSLARPNGQVPNLLRPFISVHVQSRGVSFCCQGKLCYGSFLQWVYFS